MADGTKLSASIAALQVGVNNIILALATAKSGPPGDAAAQAIIDSAQGVIDAITGQLVQAIAPPAVMAPSSIADAISTVLPATPAAVAPEA